MAGITQAQAESILDALITAQLNFNGLADVEIQGRKVVYTNLSTLNNAIDYWDNKVKELDAQGSRTGRRMRGGTPA